MSARAIGVVGKLPGWADFVRLGARGEAFESLLGWIVGGTELAAAMRRTAFAALSSGDVHAFVYRQRPSSSVLCGALAPSHDAAGRCLPVAAALEVAADDALARHPELLPILFEEAWARSGELLLELQQTTRESVGAGDWSVELPLALREAHEIYEAWTREIAVSDFWELVLGEDVSRAARVLAFVEAAASPYRGVEEPETPLSLRLPLGESGGATVCFWIDLVRRLTRRRRTIPNFFWSHDGTSGVLVLHLGFVPETALSELWLPSGTCDEICDLVPPTAPTWENDRVRVWAAALDQPGRSLASLLEAADFGV